MFSRASTGRHVANCARNAHGAVTTKSKALVLIVATLGGAGLSSGVRADSFDEPFAASATQIDSTSEPGEWRVQIDVESFIDQSLDFEFTASPVDSMQIASWTADEVIADRFEVTLVSQPSNLPTFILDVIGTYGPAEFETSHCYVYFAISDEGLVPITGDEYNAIHLTPQEGAFYGQWVPPSDEYAQLPPWENPEVLPADQEAFRLAAEALENRSGALQGTTPDDPRGAAPAETGCVGGSLGILPFVLFLGFLALRRRRAWPVAVALIVGVPSIGRAALVYGYVSFWDTRSDKSNYTGSRLPSCNTGVTSCTPGSGASCCFRGVSNVTLEFYKLGSLVTSTVTSPTGAFMVSVPNDATHGYSIYLRYDRLTGGQPADMVLASTIPPASGIPFTLYLDQFIASGTPYQSLGNYSVNAANDTNSAEGNIATIWTNVTAALYALDVEGEVRQYKNLGSPNLVDPIGIGYTILKSPVTTCDNGAGGGGSMNTWAEVARSTVPIEQLGEIYLGRSVGCLTPPAGGWSLAAFPLLPASVHSISENSSTSEGTALHLALKRLVYILTRWDPQITSLFAVGVGTSGSTCQANSGANSNDATNAVNDALALWDFLDAESAFEDAYADTIDITMKELMDGLVANKNASGSGNLSGNEASYVGYAPPVGCTSNEGCNHGDACVRTGGNCYSGDPHGENIFDLTYHLTVIALGNGWTASYGTTLESSPCIGTYDHTYSFDGGYRDD